MDKLLLKPVFDHYRVSEATITTFTTFTVDGLLHPEFYDPETISPSEETQVSWESSRSFCLSIFRGKKLPLAFRFVFQLPNADLPGFLDENGLMIDPADVFGLYLNIQYRNNTLTLTTGSSQHVFPGNRELDHAWDQHIRDFLTREELD